MEIEEETKHEVAETSGSILSAEEIQCWSSVKQDPTDFQSWIKLLQFAEQKVILKNLCILSVLVTSVTTSNL
jgi:hypothetical protein